ncbi:MAG: DUF4386 domain-containing protein, partial [Vicinamibacterales bacterium]
MTMSPVDDQQRRSARVAGIIYLASFATVIVVNFGLLAPLLSGDPSHIARNILEENTRFRVGLVGQLLYGIGVLVVTAALYIVLRPVNGLLAVLAALGRVVHGFSWLMVSINLLLALRLLTQPAYAQALPPDQLAALARFYLSGIDQYYVGLLFWALGSTVAAYLWLESGYIPRPLSLMGIAASGWAVVCCVAFFVFPEFPKLVNLWLFDIPMVLFEIAVSLR